MENTQHGVSGLGAIGEPRNMKRTLRVHNTGTTAQQYELTSSFRDPADGQFDFILYNAANGGFAATGQNLTYLFNLNTDNGNLMVFTPGAPRFAASSAVNVAAGTNANVPGLLFSLIPLCVAGILHPSTN